MTGQHSTQQTALCTTKALNPNIQPPSELVAGTGWGSLLVHNISVQQVTYPGQSLTAQFNRQSLTVGQTQSTGACQDGMATVLKAGGTSRPDNLMEHNHVTQKVATQSSHTCMHTMHPTERTWLLKSSP